MKNKTVLAFFLPTLALSGCAVQNKSDTLASLGELDIKVDKDAKIDSARDKAMATYWEFMNSAPKDSLRVEALRRMADLELESSEENYQKRLEELSKTQAQNAQKDIQQQQAKEISYDKAIKLYEDALAASSGDPNDADVLYQLAKAYEQAGKPEKAVDALDRLLASFPGIENRDEIYFRRGELLFSLKRFAEAEMAYTQAMIVDTSSPYYEKAISKKGWSAFKQNKFDNALHSFFIIVDRKLPDANDLAATDDSKLSRGDRELLQDILRVITLCFNELGGADAIENYFNNNGKRGYEGLIYKNLGDRYIEQGRVRDAADTYLAFVKRYPFHVDAPQFDMFTIKAYGGGGFGDLYVQSKIAFVQNYKINGEYWNKHDDKVHQNLIPLLETNTEDVARHFHALAQKSKDPQQYAQATVWYKQFLSFFPDSEKSPKMNFLLAETLFESKQYEQAAKEYEKTAYQYPKYGTNAEAGYAALLAYGEHSKQLEGSQKEIWDRAAIASALRFGKAFPEDKRAPAVVTKAAEDLFALKKYDEASVAARNLLELKAPTDESMRRTAWIIVAQSELQKGQYAQAESAFKVALKLTKTGHEAYASIVEGLAASVYKLGEQLKQAGDNEGAAKQFARVAAVAPDSDIAKTAQYDVAAALMAKEDWNGAIKALEEFRRKYPDHELRNQVSENLALAYEKSKQPLLAAREYENVMATQTDPNTRREMAWHIAELYQEAGMNDAMVEAYKRYLTSFPQPIEQAMEARQKLADYYQSPQQIESRRYWLSEIVAKDKNAGEQRTDRTKYLAAKASFELAQPKLEAFQNVKLVAPLKENLKNKKELMQEAVYAYTQAADYGVEEITTASIYYLGEIYNKFSKELLQSERPKELSADEREQYDILLEEQAFPFEEKSIDIHESNVKRAQTGIYNEWIKKSFTALRELRPVRYAKVERSESFADAIY